MQQIQTYINNCNRLFQTGNAREHSYRGDLQQLLNEIINDKDIVVTNEPARIVNVGAPDYSITKKDIPIGYIEAKDINKPLDSKDYKEQFDRYKNALDNLIITDYLDFWFYKQGELTNKISIAKIENAVIIPLPENFDLFRNSILSFISFVSQTITSPSKLAKLMAGKARLLENVIENAILSDEENEANNSLRNQLEIFKASLIHDITPSSFADIYAQTIAYGMFAARLHDTTLQNFSRQEAVFLIPKSNPFLRGLFNYVSGAECDDRLIWIIDSLAEIFLATDVAKLLEGFSQKTGMNDPIIHFYETFLGEYNPALRKSRGVWYTPEAVVNFIVRACDEVLKDEFGLEDGLSDETKIKIKIDDHDAGYTKGGQKRQKEIETHKVQILDPATGTGTFLAETIKHIKKGFWGGSWSSYVEEHLIPRLNGFELLMASYAMAHLKLDLLLMETGYKPINQKRFNVFLTNSLEEHHEQTGSLFSSYLANESKEADRIKKEAPVMVVMGNPPYSGISNNNIKWISDLIDDYKYVEGKHFNERKHWLNDDYVKFIRYGQHCIEKKGEGVLAFINPHGFLDNPTFRGMRWNLLQAFDKIYIIDLHGNTKKKETASDGSKDDNVFDIQQGVSINIFIKTGKKITNEFARVFHYDLYGKREIKYNFLNNNSIRSINFKELKPEKPFLLFADRENISEKLLSDTFKLEDIFCDKVTGTQTGNDKLLMSFSKEILENNLKKFTEYIDDNSLTRIDYRPFDNGFMYYIKSMTNTKNNIPIPKSYRNRYKVMRNMTFENMALIIGRQGQVVGDMPWNLSFISKSIVDLNMFYRGGGMVFPLYLYQDDNSLTNERTPNLNQEIVKELEEKLSLKFTNEKEDDSSTFAPIDILDYIYAILHSPNYRETYKEFLKIDFPRVPYPDIKTFWQLVALGGRLRAIHLLEDDSLNDRIIDIHGEGELLITNKLAKKDTVIENDLVTLNLNSEISIINIPLVAWEFYIGGYQPAQKWLKDRVGRTLSRADLKHYNKIINALCKTDAIMKEIDGVLEV